MTKFHLPVKLKAMQNLNLIGPYLEAGVQKVPFGGTFHAIRDFFLTYFRKISSLPQIFESDDLFLGGLFTFKN